MPVALVLLFATHCKARSWTPSVYLHQQLLVCYPSLAFKASFHLAGIAVISVRESTLISFLIAARRDLSGQFALVKF